MPDVPEPGPASPAAPQPAARLRQTATNASRFTAGEGTGEVG
jgi:hypothetical protein